jgi:hypothetical protein
MPVDPQLLPSSMIAIVGGLMIFAVLLLFGVKLIRWLKLPQDLPEGPRFEPPPPPSVLRGDRTAAAATAAVQARLQAIYAQAHAVVRAAAECQELHHFVRSAGPVEPFAAVAPVTERCSAAAVTNATAMEQVLSAFDGRLRIDRAAVTTADMEVAMRDIAHHALIAQGALSEARAAIAPLPNGGANRRLYILLALLAVMIAWVFAMQYILRK